jgi:hypothetical protein
VWASGDIRDRREFSYREYREWLLTKTRDYRKYPGMRTGNLEPANSVIRALGGFEAVAAITGKHISRVYRWTYPKARGGTGGYIPPAEAETLLAHAKENGLQVTAADFFSREPSTPTQDDKRVA